MIGGKKVQKRQNCGIENIFFRFALLGAYFSFPLGKNLGTKAELLGQKKDTWRTDAPLHYTRVTKKKT